MTTRAEAGARLTAPGQRFHTRVEDVHGGPLSVFANRHRHLSELLRDSARFGAADYLVTPGRRISYAEHLQQVAALAAGLAAEYGVRPGDRVVIAAANRPEWVLAFWAVISLDAVAVGANAMWAAPELAAGLELTEPTVIIADAQRAELAAESGIQVLTMDADLPALIARHLGAALPACSRGEDEPAVILFTSGTSGRSKGATHSHRNVLCAVWFHLFNDALATELGQPPSDRRYLLATPLFHIAGLHNLAVARLAVGDAVVVHQGRFDLPTVLALLETERVTNWGAVPTMLHRLVEYPQLAEHDLSALRTVTVNSAPSEPRLRARLAAALPRAAAALGTSYGLTETSTAVTIATAADLDADPETVGRPVVNMEIAVRDVDGRPVSDEGEIWVRGAQVMTGYWGDPAATAAALTPDGWLRTGDLGTINDAGMLRISSRRSDLILRGGENVYPVEVEHRLADHPAVRECVVLGVPDPDLGEAVAAVVVIDRAVTEAELSEHVAAGLARYKVPTLWALTTTELPRNATGKVIRHQVRRPGARP